jgi:DnaJ-class molecular chaperone
MRSISLLFNSGAVRIETPTRIERSHGSGSMQKKTGQQKQKCKSCEGKGLLKKGDKVVRCKRCGGTGIKQ